MKTHFHLLIWLHINFIFVDTHNLVLVFCHSWLLHFSLFCLSIRMSILVLQKRKTETEMGGLHEERFGGSGRGVENEREG